MYTTDVDTYAITYSKPYYDEMTIPASSMTGLGIASDPAMSNCQSGVVYMFADELIANEKLLYFNVELPHNYREGTNVIPNFHYLYAQESVNETTRWRLSTSWANVGDNFTVAANQWVLSDLTDNLTLKHHNTLFAPLSGTSKEISSYILCHLSRTSSDVTDNYTGVVLVTGVSFLYQIDTPGSANEWSK